MGETELVFERHGPAAVLTFNRPEQRNAMTWSMYEGLVKACDEVDEDPDIRVFVLRGAGGKAFVAGTDINQFRSFREPKDALDYESRIEKVLTRLEDVRKPTIAAVTGYAVGGGLMIALACDLRICTPDSRFGAPIARTLGNCLAFGNYARLIDLIGPARTMELIYSARLVDAEEAYRIGLVNEVIPADRFEQRLAELIKTISSHAPLTLAVTKQAVRRIQRHRRPTGGEDLIVACYMSDDFREGVEAFLSKRQPIWRGR